MQNYYASGCNSLPTGALYEVAQHKNHKLNMFRCPFCTQNKPYIALQAISFPPVPTHYLLQLVHEKLSRESLECVFLSLCGWRFLL